MFSKEGIDDLKKSREKWEKNTLPEFIKKGELKEKFVTPSGIPLKQVYTPEDLMELKYLEDLGFPGEEPFTRAIYPTMYRGRLWTMRQYSGFADASKTNERFKYMISQGQTGLSVAFDLPTQMGYDSDCPSAEGEVGRVGVSINSLKDFETLFKDIPLDKVSTSFTINAPTCIILAMYIAIAQQQKVPLSKLRGTVQNDILKEYIARGTYIFPPNPSLRLVTDVIEYCSAQMQNFNTISICGYHMREAGANAIQEIAFTIANGIAYVEEVLKRKINIDEFAPRLSFFFCLQNNFLEEIAKLRAARRIWSKIMSNRYNAKKKDSLILRFHTQTAGASLIAQQPQVNLIRVAFQALAAVLGGTQSLHTCGFDEALAIPTEESVRLSLRTQQVIAEETGVTDVVDPLGGSYYLEYLTSSIEKEVMKYLNIVEEMGGMPNAINQGYVQNEILKSAYLYQQRIEKCIDKVVGLNAYRVDEEPDVTIFELEENFEKDTVKRLVEFKKKRNQEKVKEKLNEIKRVVQTSENVMPSVVEAVKAYATVQEICDVFREVFGKYEAPSVL